MVKRSVFHGTPVFLLPLGNSTNSATFSFWKSLETFGVKVFADLEVRDRKKKFVFFKIMFPKGTTLFGAYFDFDPYIVPLGRKSK